MKILQIASGDFFSTYGGGQVYVKNIVDEMLRQRRDIVVVSFVNGSAAVEKKEYKGIALYEVGSCAKGRLGEIIDEVRPDVIHAHSMKATACTEGSRRGIPVVITSHHGGIVCPAGTLLDTHDRICATTVCHGSCLPCVLRNTRTGLYWYPFMRLLPRKWYLGLGRMLRRLPFIPFITPIGSSAVYIQNKLQEWRTICSLCTCMIAPSDAMKTAMVRNGFDEKRIKILPHGIPMPSDVPSFPAVVDGCIKFFYVGRICYVKGLHVLLEAFHRVADRRIELHLIGGSRGRAEERYERALRKRYRDDSRIFWHGKVAPNEVYGHISSLHVSSSSSYLEAFGLNIAESLAMGKPVLATRCGGAEMQIEDGCNGWLVPANDIEAMRAKIEEIIAAPERLAEMSKHCKAITIEQHCLSLMEIYENVNLLCR